MNLFRFVSLGLSLVVVVNVGLFEVARAAGGFGPGVRAAAAGAPLTAGVVAAVTVLAVVAALVVRLVLSFVVRPWRRARKAFLVLAGGLLVASFVSPLLGLEGAGVLDVLLLEVLHVTTAIAAVLVAEQVARPSWRFGAATFAERSIEPRTAVVTGATSGIGAEVARQLTRRGFRVVGLGRNAERARQLEVEHPGLTVLTGDLSSMVDAARLAGDVDRALDGAPVSLLVHCAGTLKPTASSTSEGLDANFASSFLGRLALTERLRLGPGVRVVNVAAAEAGVVPGFMRVELAHPGDVGSGMRAHGRAQLANDLWVASLARRGQSAWGYGPGSVDTGIRREVPWLLRVLMQPFFAAETRAPAEAAADIVRVLLDEQLPKAGFASRDGVFAHDAFVHDEARQERLLALAHALVEQATLTARSPAA